MKIEVTVADGRSIKTEQDDFGITAPKLDPSKYLEELQDFDMSEEQKIELLGVLVSISRTMVELGFSTELREVICEQLFEGFNDASGADVDDVKSSRSATTETPLKATERTVRNDR